MPTYDYECRQCGHLFEVRASISEKTAGLDPECPQCHGHETRQAFRSLMFISSSGSGSAPPVPSGGCGPGCGCGT
jgi:putative FmdB family regulatory protein